MFRLNASECSNTTVAMIAAGALLWVGGLGGMGGCAVEPASFDTPEAAVDSLVTALRAGDRKKAESIVGTEGAELLRSGDDVADANARDEFVRLYDEKHTLTRHDDSVTLEVGNSDWPLPIPLVQDEREAVGAKGGKGGWFFDVEAGADEVLSRRIGRNELDAIQVCLAIFDAQREYAAVDRDGDGVLEYATKFGSDAGKHDGLFWPSKAGEPESPLGELAAEASSEGYTAKGHRSGPRAYHGYYYRILNGQGASAPGGALDFTSKAGMIGGFAVIAWPAEYGGSGLKSFLVSHHGVVYEKDLGDDTDRIARAMKVFDPGEGWSECGRAGEP